jgi:hypothetical protein
MEPVTEFLETEDPVVIYDVLTEAGNRLVGRFVAQHPAREDDALVVAFSLATTARMKASMA